ncbi:hypothetical protein UFOVP592_39 [uncultured Caudovirales phage]|uniref:Uncharacterized protein n=1 Tax=uncultured Caudovirales phage TaxID=2100421 RepID=A0A6J5N3D9_9CAUD|nr:hypothetical protein UFOVP592_39 [uncultured Caudovirales phage]
METTNSPNTDTGAVATQSAVPSMDSIAAKMTAMRENTQRNLIRQQTEQTATGEDDAAADSTSVAPNGAEVDDNNNEEYASDNQEADAPEEVSTESNDSTSDELIDFLEFTESNPNAKFKFMRNGKEVIIDAKKAAAILGQGSAIHEEARQLKVERAEFDEYVNQSKDRQDQLTLAMEFTVQPKLKKAYEEIVKTQQYQNTFQQQLARATDSTQVARIQANMAQNEQYIRQQQKQINRLQPAIEQFKQIRSQQVGQALTTARKNFQDKELRNEYVYNELREKIEKAYPGAKREVVPGIPNIDLIAGDEALLSLVRDGLRYRDKPSTKTAGASMAALTSRKGSSNTSKGSDDNINKLREQAKAGDKKAGDNLLMQRLQSIRGGRR